MPDLDIVINAIENCTRKPKCQDCQWKPCEEDHERIEMPLDLAKAALELLKAQEPRLMSLQEVKGSEGRDVWLELSGDIRCDVLTAMTIYNCGVSGISTWYDSLIYSLYNKSPYGWRCWTSRPTDEQRETEPWCGCQSESHDDALIRTEDR